MTAPGGPVLLAIFGAGASYGCLPIEPQTNQFLIPPESSALTQKQWFQVQPPLTQDLVRPDELAATILGRYEAALPVVDAVRQRLEDDDSRSPTVSLEQALAAYQGFASVDPHVDRHLAALRFYLRDLLWVCSEFMQSPTVLAGATNHLTLIRQLHTWANGRSAHVCLTSFNYDFILETACRRVWEFNPHGLDHYVSYTPMSVLKPHGSVLWQWPLLEAEMTGTMHAAALKSISRAVEMTPEPGSLVPVPYSPYAPDANVSLTRGLSIPALALPMDGKSDLIWPTEQAAHFENIQSRVSKLLIVGWRAAEEHFLKRTGRLTSEAKTVIVTGGPSGPEEAMAIRDRLWGGVLDETTEWRLATDGFSAFMRSGLLQWLLDD